MELNKLYNMDCLIGMQEIPSGSVDLIIFDPPYGTIKCIGKCAEILNKDTSWDVYWERYNGGRGYTYRAQLDRLRNKYRIL